MNEKLETGHQEATTELLKLKDRAIELERNVSLLLFPLSSDFSYALEWVGGNWIFELKGIW